MVFSYCCFDLLDDFVVYGSLPCECLLIHWLVSDISVLKKKFDLPSDTLVIDI